MDNNYSLIKDISIINSFITNREDIIELFNNNFFSDPEKWKQKKFDNKILFLMGNIDSPLKKRMSTISLGIYNVIEKGPGRAIMPDDELYLISAFSEIDTTHNIIKNIVIEDANLVSPTLFHNSVHNTPLSYWTIIKNKHNYCTTISDGLDTNISFINWLKYRIQLKKDLIIACGEEYSDFFKLDEINKKEIVPSFCAYRIIPNSENGFKFMGEFKSLEEIFDTESFKNSEYLFCGIKDFYKIKNKKVFTEYPILFDNPCGIVFRLAMPFYLKIKGKGIIIESHLNNFYLYEVIN